uniref:E3 ubiquitin-protein ligase TRIM21-like n=1 Tax=Scatophagus argus TaxID=75038 RepID=UPI001ED83BA9|nr:E3 ubiquitin-protein ligase TRIM21-like [Scatophagus argus]
MTIIPKEERGREEFTVTETESTVTQHHYSRDNLRLLQNSFWHFSKVQQNLSTTDMAAASSLLSEDQFLCSICLDVFTDPVTVPCGHNFCKNCITDHWNINVHCQCPMCKKCFDRRPELYVNTFISEMVAQFRQSSVKESSCSSGQQGAKPGEVLCDVCTDTKVKALKSCLVCLTSYCETHLEPHRRIPGLKRHQLIDPVKNLERRMCKKHDRPLDLFCETDQMCVCRFCTETDHKLHHTVALEEEFERKKAELGKTDTEVQQMIQERRLKIQEVKQSVKLSREGADRETAVSVKVFTALIQSVQKGLAQLTNVIEETHKTREKQAEVFIQELEEEISELMTRSAEVEQLSRTEDHLQFLQSFPSLNPVPPTKDWTKVRVRSSYEGAVRRAVAQLEETLSKEMEKLHAYAEIKRVQQYAVDVTLDPDTANPFLILSDDGKQVSHGNVKQNLPCSSKRFRCYSIFGKQSFSSGRFYYEVQVKGKTSWILGVARGSVDRTGCVVPSPKNGVWDLRLTKEEEFKVGGSSVHLFLESKPQKVGVFVDYEEGLVSFYDVDVPAVIYSFTGCKFTEKLYSYFNPCHNCGGKNSTPLIICPINSDD